MKAMISTQRISGESIQVLIETGNDSIQFICDNDQVMLKLLKLQIKLIWTGITKWLVGKV